MAAAIKGELSCSHLLAWFAADAHVRYHDAPSLTASLVLIVVLMGFVVTQFAFQSPDSQHGGGSSKAAPRTRVASHGLETGLGRP
jgi:hypothetical protein